MNQETAFCIVKGRLLACKRQPFAWQKAANSKAPYSQALTNILQNTVKGLVLLRQKETSVKPRLRRIVNRCRWFHARFFRERQNALSSTSQFSTIIKQSANHPQNSSMALRTTASASSTEHSNRPPEALRCPPPLK